MTTIVVSTSDVRSTSGQFHAKQSDLEALVSQAKSQMSNLEASFKGQRATRIFGEWQAMQPQLQAAIGSLKTAGDLLMRASTAFEETDSAL